MKTIISVRTNFQFAYKADEKKLLPESEVIILTTQAKYAWKKKGSGISRDQEVVEHRFVVTPEGLNHLIGQLQLLAKDMTTFDQMAGAFNSIIASNDELEGKTPES